MLMNVHCTVLKNSVLHDLRKNLISKNQLLFSTWKSSWRGFLIELKLKEYYIRNLYLEHGKQFRCPIVVLLNPSSKSRRGLLVPRVDILRPSALEVKHPRVLRQLHVRLNLKFWTILDPWSNNLCIFFLSLFHGFSSDWKIRFQVSNWYSTRVGSSTGLLMGKLSG